MRCCNYLVSVWKMEHTRTTQAGISFAVQICFILDVHVCHIHAVCRKNGHYNARVPHCDPTVFSVHFSLIQPCARGGPTTAAGGAARPMSCAVGPMSGVWAAAEAELVVLVLPPRARARAGTRAREAPRERRAREGIAPAGEAGDAGRRGERRARGEAGLDAHAVLEEGDAGEARVELGERVEDAGQRVVVDEDEAAAEGGAPRAVRRLERFRRGDEEHGGGVGVRCVGELESALRRRAGARAPRRAAEGRPAPCAGA